MLTDPAKHRELCGPGHEFFLPYNNFAPTGITGMPPTTPTPPEQPSCPTHDYWHPTAYVQYTDFILVHDHEGGDWDKPKDDCRPDKPDCPASFTPLESAPSLLLVHNQGCYHPPSQCDAAWTGGSTTTIILAGQHCCVGSVTDQQQGALVLLAKNWGDKNWEYGGSCVSFSTEVPIESPAMLI